MIATTTPDINESLDPNKRKSAAVIFIVTMFDVMSTKQEWLFFLSGVHHDIITFLRNWGAQSVFRFIENHSHHNPPRKASRTHTPRWMIWVHYPEANLSAQ